MSHTRIDLTKINSYVLSCDNKPRLKHFSQEFSDFNYTTIQPITGISKCQSGASGHSRILDAGCYSQKKNKPFQPFAVYEDDVAKTKHYKNMIKIPDDADIVYIGLSTCGMGKKVYEHNVYYSKVKDNDDVVKVDNMLSTHGYIVCSSRGALSFQKAFMEAYFADKLNSQLEEKYRNFVAWDIYLAYIQPHCNVYALKKPVVYQCEKLNGEADATNITIHMDNNNIPDDYINWENVSIKMMHDYEDKRKLARLKPNNTWYRTECDKDNIFNKQYPRVTSSDICYAYWGVPTNDTRYAILNGRGCDVTMTVCKMLDAKKDIKPCINIFTDVLPGTEKQLMIKFNH